MTSANVPDPKPWPDGVTLLLGIGAQKAGTSWLHAYLRGHPACKPGPMKEMHYFDSQMNDGRLGKRLRKKALEAAQARPDVGNRVRRLKRLQEICDAPDADHQSYVDLMLGRLKPGEVALDITPEYALIPDSDFARMAALPGARMIYLMREPVARAWSAARMRANAIAESDAVFEDTARDVLEAVLGDEMTGANQRSDYADTLRKLAQHVAPERHLVLFFETLFTQASADRICQFLSIATRPVDAVSARNEGRKATMRPDQLARLTEMMRSQYDAVCSVFGDAVPQAWHARFARGATAA